MQSMVPKYFCASVLVSTDRIGAGQCRRGIAAQEPESEYRKEAAINPFDGFGRIHLAMAHADHLLGITSDGLDFGKIELQLRCHAIRRRCPTRRSLARLGNSQLDTIDILIVR